MTHGWYKAANYASARAHWYVSRGHYAVAICSPTIQRFATELRELSVIPKCLHCVRLTKV